MSLRSLTTCSYVSDATSFAMRHCTIVVTPLPMFPEPDSFRPREIHHRPNASCLGNEKKSPCRWWLIDGCKSLFNVKPSTVPTRLIPELDAHTRTTHPERFLRAEKSRRPNTQHQMGTPSMNECSAEYGMKRCSYGMFSTRAVVLAAWSFFFSRESSERQEHG